MAFAPVEVCVDLLDDLELELELELEWLVNNSPVAAPAARSVSRTRVEEPLGKLTGLIAIEHHEARSFGFDYSIVESEECEDPWIYLTSTWDWGVV